MREVWSFFSGAMGLDIGLEKAGIQSVLAVENDKHCAATIAANRPNITLLNCDIAEVTGQRLREVRSFYGDVELMVGGPPCQSFCPGGKRAALSDPRGNLIYEYLRLIAEVRPRYFVFENVANLTTAALRHRPINERPGKHWSLKRYDDIGFNVGGGAAPLDEDERASTAIRQILKDVKSLGYAVSFSVLDAADHGAPQHRLRFMMLGSRDGSAPSLPEPTHGAPGSGLIPFATVRGAIADLMDAPGAHSAYTEGVRRFFALVPQGGNWRSLPPGLQKLALGGSWEAGGGKTGFFRRLAWGAPSPTITGRANRKGSALCHPQFDRPLSVRECARLQGFPDEWIFSGAMNSQYMQIGNAVPVHLAGAVGRALAEHAASPAGRKSFGAASDFDAMLDAAIARLRASARNKKSAPARSGENIEYGQRC